MDLVEFIIIGGIYYKMFKVKKNLKYLLNLNRNLQETFSLYCKNELLSFQDSIYYKEMKALAQQLDLVIYSSFGFGEDLNTIYLGFEIKDRILNEIIWRDGEFEGSLSYATALIQLVKSSKFKFYNWDQDSDFIDTVKDIINELKEMLNSKS